MTAFARDDHGQALLELCLALGQRPDEIGDAPAPSRHFLMEAWRERAERLQNGSENEYSAGL